ncbi:unnamed protein product [Arctogadus glacialis]
MMRVNFIGWHWWILLSSIQQMLFVSVSGTEGNTIRYQTNEEDGPGTVIGNLAKDMSLSLSHASRTNFRMMKQFNDSHIRVRESDGELTVGERVDRERTCRHSPVCLIEFDVVNFSKERYKLIHVQVEVKDINDNSPEFPYKESVVEISESAAVGSRVPLDPAMDADVGSNYIQSYQVSVNSHFSIDVQQRADGVKYAELVLMKELDREVQSSYVVELVATDGGNPSRTGSTKITVKVTDFNDNSPVFDQNSFSVSLPEDSPVGTVILDLNAVDADEGSNGEVVYGFGKQVPFEIRELFKVDDRSGRLTLQRPVDFEEKATYEVDVQASDLGSNPTPSVCRIIIRVKDVNDNAPEISITPMTSTSTGVAFISEAAERDSLVALISTLDRDSGVNGQVHCTLYGHDHFKLKQAHEDSYMIVTAAALDRERIGEYNLTVMAEDFGSPALRRILQYTIRLTDENDNAPRFSKPVYEVSVLENNAPGAFITTVEARDADLGHNGKITYRLLDGVLMGSPVNTFVSLNSVTGSIYALRSFNYEAESRTHNSRLSSLGKTVPHYRTSPGPPQRAPPERSCPPRRVSAGYAASRQVKAVDADRRQWNGAKRCSCPTQPPPMFRAYLGFLSTINRATGSASRISQPRHGLDPTDRPLRVPGAATRHPARVTRTAPLHTAAQPSTAHRAVYSFVVGCKWPGLTTGTPAGSQAGGAEASLAWDTSVAIIVVLAGSCSLLLLAILLITTSCSRRRRKEKGRGAGRREDEGEGDGEEDEEEGAEGEGGAAGAAEKAAEKAGVRAEPGLAKHKGGKAFEAHPYAEPPPMAGGHALEDAGEEEGPAAGVFDPSGRGGMEGKLKGYSTLPGYGKETLRPVTVWKGNSFTTISARDPQISGKDSGKGDSDFNDSDSDVSGDAHKKDSLPPHSGFAGLHKEQAKSYNGCGPSWSLLDYTI